MLRDLFWAVLLVMWVLLLTVQSWAQAGPPDPPTPSLSGAYLCTGTDIDGTEYESTVRIRGVGHVFHVQWLELGVYGLGLQHRGMFAVVFRSAGYELPDGTRVPDGAMNGVALYGLQADGGLDGQWTAFPGGPPRPEQCKPTKGLQAAP